MSIILPTTPSRSKMTSSLQNLSSSSSFEDVKTSCAKFTAKFDAWVAQARKSRALKESEFKKALESTSRNFGLFCPIVFLENSSLKKNNFLIDKQAEFKAEIEGCTRQVMALNQGLSPTGIFESLI
jgi:hypothetical protein